MLRLSAVFFMVCALAAQTPAQAKPLQVVTTTPDLKSIVLRGKFMAITRNIREAEAAGMRVRWWDLIFYATFGVMVVQSVKMGGVLVVFSYLIIPVVCAGMFVNRFLPQLLVAWLIAFLASVLGLALSAYGDLPTGASLVCTFGALLLLCAALSPVLTRVSRR